MLTLKEKLEHGEYDHVFTREEITELLSWYDGYDNEAALDDAYSGGYIEGFDNGKEEGYIEGEDNQFEHIRGVYMETVNDAPEYAKPIMIIYELDKFFKVKMEDGQRVVG